MLALGQERGLVVGERDAGRSPATQGHQLACRECGQVTHDAVDAAAAQVPLCRPRGRPRAAADLRPWHEGRPAR